MRRWLHGILAIGALTLASGASAQEGDGIPMAVEVARATAIPGCTLFVDAAAPNGGDGAAERPYRHIQGAVDAAAAGAVICVAAGIYAEEIRPGEKPFTLAGGFQSGSGFTVRDSAAHVSRAQGNGSGSFLLIGDPGPGGDSLTAIDGFEITGYSQGVVRDFYVSQRFDLTNNFIHDNVCADAALVGGGFELINVSGTISGNVISDNSCGRGGAGTVVDNLNENAVVISGNRVDNNSGTEPDSAHGGALYVFVNQIEITGNSFTGNAVTGWGGGLYVGAYPPGGQNTSARMSWNRYTGNRAGIAGGGFFCDDGATCTSEHEIYVANCGGNVLLDSGYQAPTTAHFDHTTNVGALDVDCKTPGPGVRIDNDDAADVYSFRNALFWGNGPGLDFAVSCNSGCGKTSVKVANSMFQPEYLSYQLELTLGDGNLPPVDPLFADPDAGDYHLKSTAGRWTPGGYVQDDATSPAIGMGAGANDRSPGRAGERPELGAYGNSPQASYAP